MLKLGDLALVNRAYQLAQTLIFLTWVETVESTSSTVEDTAAESVCGQDVNQSLSQPTKYILLPVHKAPELTKLQAALMWELGRHGRWNWHTKPSYDGKVVSFVEVESLWGATIYPL